MTTNYEFNRSWLISKFREIQESTLFVLDQLDNEDLNWRPNAYSNSIANLVKHINGYIKERIEKGILTQSIYRNREEELGETFTSKEELLKIIKNRFDFVIYTIESISDELLEATQHVRGKDRTNLDMLHQCAAHFSEHMGQIIYIAKIRLGEQYNSLTGPIKPLLHK